MGTVTYGMKHLHIFFKHKDYWSVSHGKMQADECFTSSSKHCC